MRRILSRKAGLKNDAESWTRRAEQHHNIEGLVSNDPGVAPSDTRAGRERAGIFQTIDSSIKIRCPTPEQMPWSDREVSVPLHDACLPKRTRACKHLGARAGS